MWDLYSNSNQGIAVQTTYRKLHTVLDDSINFFDMGIVKYINYDSEVFLFNNIIHPIIHKRLSFNHENELRVVTSIPENNIGVLHGTTTVEALGDLPNKYGVKVKIILQDLIENIYIAPNAPSWLHKLVDSVCVKYGLVVPIHQSQISEAPIY